MTVLRGLVLRSGKTALLFGALLTAALALPAAAGAATITVTTSSDVSASQCTLRDAIEAAGSNTVKGKCLAGSADPTVDTIQFASGIGNTIVAATSLPSVFGDIAIVGPGAGALTISGGDAVPLFEVQGPASTATISGLTIAHAKCGFACALRNVEANVILEKDVFEQNLAVEEGGSNTFPEGGAIVNQGTMTVIESTIARNSAKGIGGSSQNGPEGGGIYNNTAATLTLERSTVTENSVVAVSKGAGTTNAVGGGILNTGNLVIRQSTVSDNSASAGGSTTSNTADAAGIAAGNSAAIEVTIDRSTISGNSALAIGAGTKNAYAGGIAIALSKSVTIESSTIAGNRAPVSANLTGGSVATLTNTIVADPGGGGENCGKPVTSAGFNLESTDTCGFSQATDKTKTDPLLATEEPAANGGPTPTFALLEGSPAIDAGHAALGETLDQRGLTRPVDLPAVANAAGSDGTDIGAFEVQLPPAPEPEPEPEPGPGPGPIPTGPIPGSPPPGVGSPGNPAPKDTTRPTVTIKGLRAVTAYRRLKIRFSSSEAGSTFRCKLDKAPYRSCRSPYKTMRLELGTHRFAVIATDAAGNASRPATKKFKVFAPQGV